MSMSALQQIQGLVPKKLRLALRYRVLKHLRRLDVEMLWLESRMQQKRTFLDVGSNAGVYSYHFSKSFQRVFAFEPLKEMAELLRSANIPNIQVINKAASHSIGNALLYVPITAGKESLGLATLETKDPDVKSREILITTIDSYAFEDVDLIKIDVEGHELDVIKGARRTIARSKPTLLMEIEQRHISHPITESFNSILELGYEGYFLKHGNLNHLESFDVQRDQLNRIENPSDDHYINNFIFTPIKK